MSRLIRVPLDPRSFADRPPIRIAAAYIERSVSELREHIESFEVIGNGGLKILIRFATVEVAI